MRVSRWGNSLAIRLPASVVGLLSLQDGDEILVEIAGAREFRVSNDRSRDHALKQLKELDWTLPPDFVFAPGGEDDREG
jgi:antitoxin MazE